MEDAIIKQLKNKNVYIYGAGTVGKAVLQFCKQNNIDVVGFCVTDLDLNLNIVDDKKVYQFDKLDIDVNKTAFVLGVTEQFKTDVKKYLNENGAENVIDVPLDQLNYQTIDKLRYNCPVIEVTPKIGCNVNCKYCPQDLLLKNYYKNDKNRISEMTLELYKKYLSNMPQETAVDFSGFVEPFLNNEAIDMMEYTAKSGHKMTLFTTFKGLTYDEFKRVSKLPFEFVCLHTPDVKGYSNIPMTEEYIKILTEAVSIKKPNGTAFIDMANCQSEPHPDIVKITHGKLKISSALQDRAGSLGDEDSTLEHASHSGRIKCSRAKNLDHFVLLPDGTVVLCCNDFGLQYEMGNLNDQNYDEIINGNKMKELKKALSSNSEDVICRNCVYAVDI